MGRREASNAATTLQFPDLSFDTLDEAPSLCNIKSLNLRLSSRPWSLKRVTHYHG